jgi:predicted GNAT superfamily acetyltransferase
MAEARVAAEIVPISTPDECAQLAALLAGVWGLTESTAVASPDILRAMAHSGGYVTGVLVDGRLVGGGFGWPSQVGDEWWLHSHVVGFVEEFRGRGLGVQIKHHQRDFAKARGMAAVEWTYDPLHAANANFNLMKLGARVVSFHRDFYGELKDTFNAGLGSDRFLVRWGIDDEPPTLEGEEPPTILSVGGFEEPVIMDSDAAAVRAEIPHNILAVRSRDRTLALAWRDAFASTVGSRVSGGSRVVGFSAEGAYLLRD